MPTDTEASASFAAQPTSHKLSQRKEMLPDYMKTVLKSYSGNTEESRLLVLRMLEEDLRSHPDADLIQVTRKGGTNGRLGGIENTTCRDCDFSGTFQKTAEHRTSRHWRLSLWSCTNCHLKYRRKHDLARHLKEGHDIPTARSAKKDALLQSQPRQDVTPQPKPTPYPPTGQDQRSQHRRMSMSPMGSRSEPHQDEQWPSSLPPTLPTSSGSMSRPSGQLYGNPGGHAQQQLQSPFASPPLAGYALSFPQAQNDYIHTPHVRHDQAPGERDVPVYSMGYTYLHDQYASQMVHRHANYMNDAAALSTNGTNKMAFNGGMGEWSLTAAYCGPTRYFNEGEVCDGMGAQSVDFTEGNLMTRVLPISFEPTISRYAAVLGSSPPPSS